MLMSTIREKNKDKSVEWITFTLIQIHIGISHKVKIHSEIYILSRTCFPVGLIWGMNPYVKPLVILKLTSGSVHIGIMEIQS